MSDSEKRDRFCVALRVNVESENSNCSESELRQKYLASIRKLRKPVQEFIVTHDPHAAFQSALGQDLAPIFSVVTTAKAAGALQTANLPEVEQVGIVQRCTEVRPAVTQ